MTEQTKTEVYLLQCLNPLGQVLVLTQPVHFQLRYLGQREDVHRFVLGFFALRKVLKQPIEGFGRYEVDCFYFAVFLAIKF